MSNESKSTRLLFLDNIKILFVILVIFQHAAITYGVMGWWYYISSENELNPADPFSPLFFLILTLIGGLFQASLMGLFFLMGGYFTPKSYDRKGAPTYWKERLIRLGIPLLLYIVLIDPIMVYMLSVLEIQPWSTFEILQGSFLEFYLSRFQSLEGLIDFFSSTGPMWFLSVLLILTACYTLWRLISKSGSLSQYIPEKISIPKYPILLLLSIILGILTFVLRLAFPVGEVTLGIPMAFFIQYFMMFSVGVISVRNEWFEIISRDQIKIWALTIITAVICFVIYLLFFLGPEEDLNVLVGGPNLHALVYALIDNVICMGMIFVLIPITRAKFNDQGNVLKSLSSSAYHMYLVHAPVLVLLSLVLKILMDLTSIGIFPVIKLAIAFPTTIILCYLLSRYVLQKIL
ncbi:MAG: acyltransferase family protein [Candidatus Heimdallarchaeota archaeon]|nr:MAG: acyltransferase family protein [Candidatus Heimdallarchaeota archaeon]